MLSTYRKRAWLTQEQLVERAGLSVRTVSNLEPTGCAARTVSRCAGWPTRSA